MIMSEVSSTLFNCTRDDEIVVANQEEYYAGTPQYSNVRDIVKENGKLIVLI